MKGVENMNFLIMFVLLSIINVIFSTIRSITTIKSGKVVASLISAGYFAFYNIMLIYTVMDFSMLEKCVITFLCNLIGVYIVKLIEEKMRKDKLWKVEMALPKQNPNDIHRILDQCGIPNSWAECGNWLIFNCYCMKSSQTAVCQSLVKEYHGKISAYESAPLC